MNLLNNNIKMINGIKFKRNNSKNYKPEFREEIKRQ